MNAISIQNPEDDKVLESHGLAAMTFTLNWRDGCATHEDEMHVEKFSVWREADFLPADIGRVITGMHAGETAQAAVSAGELTGTWDTGRQFSADPSVFDRHSRRGLEVEPRHGRFYPQGFFHGVHGVVREALEPARITALDSKTMRVDVNHPFARFPVQVQCMLNRVLPGSDRWMSCSGFRAWLRPCRTVHRPISVSMPRACREWTSGRIRCSTPAPAWCSIWMREPWTL